MLAALLISAPIALLLCALLVSFLWHPYAATIGWRYMRSKKRRTVSVITFVAVSGVALGVASLLAVMSITSGFQDEFRDKVLGVNAHVLVLKYGLDFEEYRDVMERAREMPEVAGAAPFLINEMMLAHGDRISGVLVKGVDEELIASVLDLPEQLIQGGIEGMRAEGATPPLRPEDLLAPYDDDWRWLSDLADTPSEDGGSQDQPSSEGTPPEPAPEGPQAPGPEAIADTEPSTLPPGLQDSGFVEVDSLPTVDVPSPEEAEAALLGGEAGLPADDLLNQFFEEEELVLAEDDTRVIATEDLPGIVIGTTLATNLGLGVGNRVQVISPLAGLDTSLFTGSNEAAPRSREFRVSGIFSAGFEEYDTRLVYVDLYEAQHFFNHGDSVTGVELRLTDIDAAPEVARRLERVLGGGPYHTMDWQELNHNLFTALEIQKVMLSLVIATIIFVAAFNVIATLIMIVIEKKREIAILKAMGARSFGILLIFMVQGLLIGLLGTLIGLILGGGVCWYLEQIQFPLDPHVYLIDHLPIRTSIWEFITTIATALLICMIATLIPSLWAARLLPAEGVRYE